MIKINQKIVLKVFIGNHSCQSKSNAFTSQPLFVFVMHLFLAITLRDAKQRRLKFPALGTNLKIHSPQNDLAKISNFQVPY